MESTEDNAMSNDEFIKILAETIDELISWCYSVDPETNEWVAYDPDRAEIELTTILISCAASVCLILHFFCSQPTVPLIL